MNNNIAAVSFKLTKIYSDATLMDPLNFFIDCQDQYRGQRKKGSMILLSLAGLHFAAVTVAAWCGTNVMLRKPFLCMSSVHSVIARQAKAEPFV